MHNNAGNRKGIRPAEWGTIGTCQVPYENLAELLKYCYENYRNRYVVTMTGDHFGVKHGAGRRVRFSLLALIALFGAGTQGADTDRSSSVLKPEVEVIIKTPGDYQVFQRHSRQQGFITMQGLAKGSCDAVQVRLTGKSIQGDLPGQWEPLSLNPTTGEFQGKLPTPAGGWYRVEVQASRGGETIGHGAVAHVGVGEVFVVAGQSNAGNYGSEKQRTTTGMVSSFDGRTWRMAEDPQAGAGGTGGSFMPPMGDELFKKWGVPVAVAAVAAGGTSVREWLPKGELMQQPPTTGGNVVKVGTNEWAATGTLFENLMTRCHALGKGGFRAVLWHQGESDAGQTRWGYPAAVQISGKQYTQFMGKLIRASRMKAGWEMPWIVALTTIHSPTEAPDEEFRSAQRALWTSGLAVEGPDTDVLNGDNRCDVHFNGKGLRAHGTMWAEKIAAWLEQPLSPEGARYSK